MLGAIAGDIIGAPYEWHNTNRMDFEFFRCDERPEDVRFTDDSVQSFALAHAILHCDPPTAKDYAEYLLYFGHLYQNRGEGAGFKAWVENGLLIAKYSDMNGASMRVSPISWMSDDIEVVHRQALLSAAYTHNHPDAIKCASIVACAGLLARLGKSRDSIFNLLPDDYKKNTERTTLDLIDEYGHSAHCLASVPKAIKAFVESTSWEDAVRRAVAMGGDSDSIAAMTGGIAECAYGLPIDIETKVLEILDKSAYETLTVTVKPFIEKYVTPKQQEKKHQ